MSIKKADNTPHFGEKIKFLRKRAKLSQADLATYSNLARDTISRYERGELTPSIEVFQKITNVFRFRFDFEVSAEWLLWGDEDAPATGSNKKVLLDSFGSMVRINFDGKGTADVLLDYSEVVSMLQGCILHEKEASVPDQKFIENCNSIIDHFYSDKNSNSYDMIAKVFIANHSATITNEKLFYQHDTSDFTTKAVKVSRNPQDTHYKKVRLIQAD